jgi:hypothetical protein
MNRVPILFLVLTALVVGALVSPTVQALSTPLGDLQNCNNITVGSSAVVSSDACMGGTGSSIVVQNESTSCIRVGGPNVTATTGLSVGSGCAAGPVVTFDAKRVYMISVSGSVSGVDVVWGHQ